MNYYMLSASSKEHKEKTPSIFITKYEDVKSVKSCIQHMKNGGFEDDYRVVKRVSKTGFICVDTKQVFQINPFDKLAYTVKAWEEFLQRNY